METLVSDYFDMIEKGGNWKHIALDAIDVVYLYPKYEHVLEAFHDWYDLVWMPICNACHGERLHVWIYRFFKAVHNGTPIPPPTFCDRGCDGPLKTEEREGLYGNTMEILSNGKSRHSI